MRIHDPGRVLRAGVADRAHDAFAPREPAEHVARAPRDRQRPHPIGDRLHPVALQPPAVRLRLAGARAGLPRAGRSSPPRPAPMASRLRSRRPGSVCMARDRRSGSPAGNHRSGKAMFLNALVNDDAARSIISVRPKTGDLAVARRRRRVFSWRILRRVGIFGKKSSPSRAEKAASGDVGALRATPKRPTSRVGYQNRIRPRLRGHQTSSTASTRLASQTLFFSTLQ